MAGAGGRGRVLRKNSSRTTTSVLVWKIEPYLPIVHEFGNNGKWVTLEATVLPGILVLGSPRYYAPRSISVNTVAKGPAVVEKTLVKSITMWTPLCARTFSLLQNVLCATLQPMPSTPFLGNQWSSFYLYRLVLVVLKVHIMEPHSMYSLYHSAWCCCDSSILLLRIRNFIM